MYRTQNFIEAYDNLIIYAGMYRRELGLTNEWVPGDFQIDTQTSRFSFTINIFDGIKFTKPRYSITLNVLDMDYPEIEQYIQTETKNVKKLQV